MKIEQRYHGITLIEKRSTNTAEALQGTFPDRRLCLCDFYVAGSEAGLGADGVVTYRDLLIIDHHAPVPAMMRPISSAVIANAYVRRHGPLDPDDAVAINHTDTDSILAALIMRGVLEPDAEYGEAAVSADHRGGTHPIAELLQTLDEDRSLKTSIDLLLKYVARRHRVRRMLRAKVDSGEVRWTEGVATFILDARVDAGLAPGVLPEADAVVVASPMEDGDKPWRIRVRLGPHTTGVALNAMDLPDAGGRWNAVSTTRHGGTEVEPTDYAKIVAAHLRQTSDDAPRTGLNLSAPPARCAIQSDAAHYRRARQQVGAFEAFLRGASLPQTAQDRLWDALSVMLDVHICQDDRPNGQPYVTHPLEVALWLVQRAGVEDPEKLAAALLHDTVEDQAAKLIARCGEAVPDRADLGPAAHRAIAGRFGARTAELVARLTNPPAYENATDLPTKWRWYLAHIRRLWEEDAGAAALKMADFAQNALRLDRIDSPGTKVKLLAKYRPVMRFFIQALHALDDPSHPLYDVRDALAAEMTAVYDRDYGRTLVIPLRLEAFGLAEAGVVVGGTTFAPKDEVHITVIGKDLARALDAAIARDPEVEHPLDLAIVEAPWYAPDWSYARTGTFYHVVEDKTREQPDGRVEILHAESIIEMVNAPDVAAFFAQLNAITGETYEVPPLHVTLYTHGDPHGIGIPTQEAFDRLVVRELSPDAVPCTPGQPDRAERLTKRRS